MDPNLTTLAAAIVVAGSTLGGIMLTLRSANQQQARTERLQTRRDEQAQAEIRTYRNHDRRASVASEYIAALNLFRRGVKDLDETKIERVEEVDLLARKAADAGALVDLYFSKSAREASAKASRIVTDMHGTRLRGGLKGRDVIEGNDNEAKAARDELVIQLRRELGEPAVS